MKKKIYEILRKQVARRATYKLGKVEITDDEIICYVDGRKLKKKEKYLYRYNLIFKMINPEEELYKIYKVDKPVHYIIKNVDFDRGINIQASAKKCHVTFENCTFIECIGIDFADHVTFVNNTYRVHSQKNYYSLIPDGHFYVSTRTNKYEINKLEFLNDEMDIPDIQTIPIIKATESAKRKKYIKNPILELWLYAKEINLINTDIVDAESIEIEADKLYLNNATISSNQIGAIIDNVESYYCNVTSDIISLDVDNYIGVVSAKYKTLFINGVEVNKNESVIDNESLSLQKQRLELINTLKKIQSSCEETISREIKKQPIKRILKK